MQNKLFDLMFKKQAKLNDLTYPNWKLRLSRVDWKSAVLVEAGELLESFGYKWWKKQEQEKDIDNIKVELIDILHFMLSLLHYESEFVREIAKNKFVNSFKEEKQITNDKEFKMHLISITGYNAIDFAFEDLAELFKYVGMNFDEVYKAYFTKNVLNEFRQKNGYKTGNYIKIWRYNNSAVEDNVVAYDIATKFPADENFEKELLKELEKIYKNIL